MGDGVGRLEHRGHHGAGGHEGHQLVVERPLPVDLVERLRPLAGEPLHAQLPELETLPFEAGEDLSDGASGYGVGLDDQERALGLHLRPVPGVSA